MFGVETYVFVEVEGLDACERDALFGAGCCECVIYRDRGRTGGETENGIRLGVDLSDDGVSCCAAGTFLIGENLYIHDETSDKIFLFAPTSYTQNFNSV